MYIMCIYYIIQIKYNIYLRENVWESKKEQQGCIRWFRGKKWKVKWGKDIIISKNKTNKNKKEMSNIIQHSKFKQY